MPKSGIAATLSDRINLSGKRLRQAALGVTLAATTVVAGAAGQALAAPLDHAPIHTTLQQAGAAPLTYGQDVSNYQPDHDWTASPAQFGIIKASEGTGFRDRAFARHWRELDKKGIVRGAYHYGHPGNDPIAEAEHFLSVVNSQPAKPGDLLVLDLETTDGRSVAEVNAWAKTWLAHVKAKTGATPIFYSGWNFADTYGKGLAEYPLWVAHYSRPKGAVSPPADWKTWTIHQYSDSPIDQNVSALTPDQLRSLGRPER
ncbi:GH25 family lysozyme M1 (1,4-beta-N-acetylmuramidase) [Thermocatellispora tengchongensis]|uniref:GH25 family lysozyme M1 (1,4-beta-N-acetylmuramidase) n=1 Tax=Thermocatellispora tengchongensis TaxID=1073253 RepID=A0A840P6Q9_9ACTN|nr:GH25 family lysozyme [Thermocatellispora tengchongensis]MBB5133593.1 GH25 family lysozyme M1 (1,4-beta-N-acetylmuramidase) [Thermocatellispora tengchongensis]